MIERLAYLVKTHLPGIFPVIAYAGRVVTVLRFSRQRAAALAEASVQGELAGQRAVMRPLGLDDLARCRVLSRPCPSHTWRISIPMGLAEPISRPCCARAVL